MVDAAHSSGVQSSVMDLIEDSLVTGPALDSANEGGRGPSRRGEIVTVRPEKDPSTADGPPMSREAMDRFLARPLIARLATTENDQPRVLPMWFWWDGTDVWMETSPTFANARILRRNPQAALTVDEALSGLALRAVVMRGRVEIIDAPLDQVVATVRRIHARYLSPAEQSSEAGRALQLGSHVLLRFIPERTMTWDTSA